MNRKTPTGKPLERRRKLTRAENTKPKNFSHQKVEHLKFLKTLKENEDISEDDKFRVQQLEKFYLKNNKVGASRKFQVRTHEESNTEDVDPKEPDFLTTLATGVLDDLREHVRGNQVEPDVKVAEKLLPIFHKYDRGQFSRENFLSLESDIENYILDDFEWFFERAQNLEDTEDTDKMKYYCDEVVALFDKFKSKLEPEEQDDFLKFLQERFNNLEVNVHYYCQLVYKRLREIELEVTKEPIEEKATESRPIYESVYSRRDETEELEETNGWEQEEFYPPEEFYQGQPAGWECEDANNWESEESSCSEEEDVQEKLSESQILAQNELIPQEIDSIWWDSIVFIQDQSLSEVVQGEMREQWMRNLSFSKVNYNTRCTSFLPVMCKDIPVCVERGKRNVRAIGILKYINDVKCWLYPLENSSSGENTRALVSAVLVMEPNVTKALYKSVDDEKFLSVIDKETCLVDNEESSTHDYAHLSGDEDQEPYFDVEQHYLRKLVRAK